MNLLQAFDLGVRNLRRRKVRSWLTVIGIFIGIAAVVSLVSVSEGLKVAISDQFGKIGSDKLFAFPKSSEVGGLPGIDTITDLTEDDVDAIEKVNGVKVAAGQIFEGVKIEFEDELKTGILISIPDDRDKRDLVIETNLLELEQGRMLKKGDKFKVVIGNAYATTEIFDRKIKLNDEILINDLEFKVVGILRKIAPDTDRSFFMAENFMRDILENEDKFDFVSIQVQKGEDPIDVQENIERALRKERDVDKGEEDFDIESPEQLLESLGVILNIVQVVLIGIAGISLIVGGIGIMNTMYTSVLERRGEIGIMKAIGARNNDILTLFLVESGLLGLVGGIIGVLVGWAIAKLIEIAAFAYIGNKLLVAILPPSLIVGVLVFSFVVGSISGVLPARQASKMKVVDALRSIK